MSNSKVKPARANGVKDRIPVNKMSNVRQKVESLPETMDFIICSLKGKNVPDLNFCNDNDSIVHNLMAVDNSNITLGE